VNKLKISKLLVLVGSFLIISYFTFDTFIESSGGIIRTPLIKTPLIVNQTIEDNKPIIVDFKTTQAKYQLIFYQKSQGVKLEILNHAGEKENPIITGGFIHLTKLEKEKNYKLIVTPSKSSVWVDAVLVTDKNISYVTDYLPRHGVNIAIIGFGMFVVGGIIFLIYQKEHSQKKSENS